MLSERAARGAGAAAVAAGSAAGGAVAAGSAAGGAGKVLSGSVAAANGAAAGAGTVAMRGSAAAAGASGAPAAAAAPSRSTAQPALPPAPLTGTAAQPPLAAVAAAQPMANGHSAGAAPPVANGIQSAMQPPALAGRAVPAAPPAPPGAPSAGYVASCVGAGMQARSLAEAECFVPGTLQPLVGAAQDRPATLQTALGSLPARQKLTAFSKSVQQFAETVQAEEATARSQGSRHTSSAGGSSREMSFQSSGKAPGSVMFCLCILLRASSLADDYIPISVCLRVNASKRVAPCACLQTSACCSSSVTYNVTCNLCSSSAMVMHQASLLLCAQPQWMRAGYHNSMARIQQAFALGL